MKFVNQNIIQICIFVAVSLSIFICAYFGGSYISPDSANYMREANALLNGYGMSVDGAAGIDSWFAVWPVGYPFLIATIAKITGVQIYLASKILSILILLFIHIILFSVFRKHAWIYALITTGNGFLQNFYYTHSEQPFILGLLMLSVLLWKISISNSKLPLRFALLVFVSLWLFLSRYIGMFAIACIGLFCLYQLAAFIKSKKKNCLHKAIYAASTAAFILALEAAYLWLNIQNSGYATGQARLPAEDSFILLFMKFAYRLIEEYRHIFSVFFTPSIPMICIALLLCVIGFVKIFKKNKISYDDRVLSAVFMYVGVLYMVCIALMRFMSEFDSFNFRLMFPGTFCIVIGLAHIFIINYADSIHGFVLRRYVKNILATGLLFCIICTQIILMIQNQHYQGYSVDQGYSINPYTIDSYRQAETKVLDKYSEIPDRSVILCNIDYRVGFLRGDIVVDFLDYPETKVEFEKYINTLLDTYNHVYVETGENLTQYIESISDPALKQYLETLQDRKIEFVEIT
jgi:hypothetical protein